MAITMGFPQITGIHIHQFPSGTWGFVGKVPVELSYRCSPQDAAVIAQSGPAIARDIARAQGREFVTITHPTQEAAQGALDAWRAARTETVA